MLDRTQQNGKKVAIIPCSHVLSHVARCLMIARSLRERGDQVYFAGGGRYLEIARKDGFEVLPLYEVAEADFIASVRSIAGFARLYTEALITQIVEDELRLFRETRPDVVLYDFRAFASISAQVAGIPHVALVNAYLTRHGTLWSGIPLHARLFLAPLHRSMNVKSINRVRRRYHLPVINGWDRRYASPLVLMPDVPEFAPTHQLPPHLKYIGPLVWEPDGKLPEVLERFDPRRKILYFTLGSTGLAHLFPEVIANLRETQHNVVVSTGNHGQQIEPNSLPGNFYVTDYVPGTQMAAKCDLVICHGGNTTIYQALSAGVPVIAIPTHMDQRFNADLLTNSGAGVLLPLEQVSQISRVSEEVLENKSYKENALRMQKILSGYNGPETAAHLIHEFI